MARILSASDLMHRVAIEAPVDGKKDDGSPKGTHSVVATGVPANVLDGTARDVVEARKADARVSSIVRIRYFRELTGKHRFDFNGRKLNIVGAPTNPDGRRIEHLCFCSEAANG